jgi:CheY-like chemotaxis protein
MNNTHVLVVDRQDGVADILMDSVGRLLTPGHLATVTVDRAEALRQYTDGCFDLVVVSLDRDQPLSWSLLPQLHAQRPEVPIVLVDREVNDQVQERAEQHHVREVVRLPRRATELRSLVVHMAQQYLQPHLYC